MDLRRRDAAALACALVIGAVGAHFTTAQQPAFRRTLLQTHDLTAPGREAVMAIAEFPPNAVAPRHTHAGEELGYVLEGTAVLEVDGKPPVTLTAGQSFFVEAGIPHGARNVGATTAKVLSVYVVEKGRPLATPVP
jgi:quercetin dioxygenase-like cupin family protein